MNESTSGGYQERTASVINGWVMLPAMLAMMLGSIALFIYSIVAGHREPIWWLFVVTLLAFPASILLMTGFFTLQPNEARVLILFGDYRGTVREAGFHWGNPFYANRTRNEPALGQVEMREGQPNKGQFSLRKSTRFRISLRVRNFLSDKLKVNDKRGSPIEIAAVIVWHVSDTAQAVFNVDNYENYVRIQTESAIRHLASAYAYDHGEENEITLRSGVDEVSQALRAELQARLNRAGVTVDEARLTHLAYAPEIAQAMLRRQQAEAVIAARTQIVLGAVSMVDMALRELETKDVVKLDEERKAAMVSNLLVVLCGTAEASPVNNTGTLYG
jgi:regulator of protease activity HflC (stomatin/prohibitin superfamily)